MELSSAALDYLRDEAYVHLCREVVQEKLNALEREKATIASTRPPFGVLARKETRDAFTHSMRTALDNEVALRERLDQVVRLDDWLRPVIRQEVVAYLDVASPDYRRFKEIAERLNEWERSFAALPELLKAFARDLRVVREEISAGAASGRQHVQSLAVLRDVALRLEKQHGHLIDIALALHSLTQSHPDLVREIRLPGLPEFRRVSWVSRLALIPVQQAVAEASRVETEVREFAAYGHAASLARIEASRHACTQLQERFLDYYWQQLRTHAQAHYVEERDIDDVLDELAQRYVKADIVRCQRALTRDPFMTER